MARAPSRVTAHPRVWWSRIKLRWPFVVWLAAVVGVAYLYALQGQTASISGAIEVVREDIAPLESARLLRVHVEQGDRVKAGDLVAEMDTAVLDAEIAQIKAENSLNQQELDARMALERLQLERQTARTIADAENRIRTLQLQYATDSNRLDGLRAQLKVLAPVLNGDSTEFRQLVVLRTEEEVLARNVALYPATIRQIEGERDAARAELDSAHTWSSASTNLLAHLPDAGNLLATLDQRKSFYKIFARRDGTVSRVMHGPGDVVPAASPIVSTVVADTQRVVAFVPEWLAHGVKVGDVAHVTRPDRTGDPLTGKILALGPEIVALPGRVSPVPDQTTRSLRALLTVNEKNDLMPGEAVTIHFSRPAWIDQVDASWRDFLHRVKQRSQKP